ncbi:hypothetical protein TKK_0000071 [Trichogramma kaykai]
MPTRGSGDSTVRSNGHHDATATTTGKARSTIEKSSSSAAAGEKVKEMPRRRIRPRSNLTCAINKRRCCSSRPQRQFETVYMASYKRPSGKGGNSYSSGSNSFNSTLDRFRKLKIGEDRRNGVDAAK